MFDRRLFLKSGATLVTSAALPVFATDDYLEQVTSGWLPLTSIVTDGRNIKRGISPTLTFKQPGEKNPQRMTQFLDWPSKAPGSGPRIDIYVDSAGRVRSAFEAYEHAWIRVTPYMRVVWTDDPNLRPELLFTTRRLLQTPFKCAGTGEVSTADDLVLSGKEINQSPEELFAVLKFVKLEFHAEGNDCN